MHAVDVAERRDAERGQVGALPQPVAVDERRRGRVLHGRVGAADGVARAFERVECLAHPAPPRLPTGDAMLELAAPLQQVGADRRVVRQLHLVDGHAVRGEIERPPHAVVPVVVGLAEHAGDQVDVDLREAKRARVRVGAVDLGRAVRPPVQLEDLVVEVLDAQAEPRDPDVVDRAQFRLGDRARLAFERDLLGRRPRRMRGEPAHERGQLPRREERRRAAAEVDEVDRPAGDGPARAQQVPLAHEQVEIARHLLRVLVRVDAEVAEVAPLAAEGDVQVQAERHRRRSRVERRLGLVADRVRRPDRERGIVSDEVAADFAAGEVHVRWLVHVLPSSLSWRRS